jgi:uncharacterized protein YuzB (UPF0349 family)
MEHAQPLVETNVKLTMYQGVVSLRSTTLEDVVGNVYTFVNERMMLPDSTCCMIDDLTVIDVKFLRKGKLGDVVLSWIPTVLPEQLPLNEHSEHIGSIQFSCLTKPGDLKVSLLYFLKGHSLKISGGFPPFDVIKYMGLDTNAYVNAEYESEDCQIRIIDDGIRSFFGDVVTLSSALCGTKVVEHRSFIVSGQSDIGHGISYVREQLYHFIKDTKLFDRVLPPMEELGGRRTAFKLYIRDHDRGDKEYSCAFDHKGKIQMFSCANYAQVYRLKKLTNEIIDMGILCCVIELVL